LLSPFEKEDFLSGKNKNNATGLKKMTAIDDIDQIIIKHLLKDARTKIKDIAKDCKISSPAVKNRIDKLKKDLIIGEQMVINWNFFNYHCPASVAVNLQPDRENDVCELLQKKKIKLISVDYFVGSYDLCFFVFAKSIQELRDVEDSLLKIEGVHKVDILIWSKVYTKFDNFKI
jgi:DNA-binding Lrp family transcriptional regulator